MENQETQIQNIIPDSKLSSRDPQTNDYEELRTCQRCGVEFIAMIHAVNIGGAPLTIGGKYCNPCRKIIDAEQKKAERTQLTAQASSTRRRWRETCGIPLHFQGKDFSNFDKSRQKGAYDLGWNYAENFPVGKPSTGYPSLLLYSKMPEYGVGKTHLAAAIGHRILDRHSCLEGICPVQFITETDILMRIRTTYDREYTGESEEAIFRSLKARPLLILDDVGKEQPADRKFMQRVYFIIVDGRYQRMLPIVITSNMDTDELWEYMGGAAVDRLYEMAQGKVVRCSGESYRKRKIQKVEVR